ncbi:HpcH/HpaI aldolase family protein [Labrys monachus]|uniref:4-hydroxy-2-oxoheptanedioate aldolase n=1 Tax=Labrys monachus TaxID=217067 RepID=A0ABU0FDB4_9HYPH|nr:aldolase/citrate lyase family protein [Labrys monachus]MDQ0392070.1 4-hydroxy-2-oxoheptanedioate aldolase [Labrys monachus]
MAISNPLRQALQREAPVLGVWLQLAHPGIAEMMGLLGYDIVLIDMEHGPGSLMDTANMMRGVQRSGAGAMVRVPSADPAFLKPLLDQGPDGVMIPMIESAEEARRAVAACRYPPLGTRGWAASSARASRYGIDQDYTLGTARGLVIACQIESVRAVEAIEAICEVEGIDIVFIGRNDLAADAGHTLGLDHPDVNSMVDHVLAVARKAGLKTGTVPSAGRGWPDLFRDGFDVVLPSGDVSLLREAAKTELSAFAAFRGGGAGLQVRELSHGY